MFTFNSSAIRAADYDPQTQQMKIWFINNGPYTYYRVPTEIYIGLCNATSPGTYYHQYIEGRFR